MVGEMFGGNQGDDGVEVGSRRCPLFVDGVLETDAKHRLNHSKIRRRLLN